MSKCHVVGNLMLWLIFCINCCFQFMERGVLCDVFVAVRPNLYISGFLDLTVNTTVTFWFLAVSIEASCCGLYFV